MNLRKAFRLELASAGTPVISFVGAGGKTTAIFRLAREFLEDYPSVVITATTHFAAEQIQLADHHVVDTEKKQFSDLPTEGVILITGGVIDGRTAPIGPESLKWLRESHQGRNIPLLIEADGSRQKPVKSPASHEPPIPDFCTHVIVVSGLAALGQPLSDEFVHRPEIFSELSGLQKNDPVTADALVKVLTHPHGGLKNIPLRARKTAFLNQAESTELQSIGGNMAIKLLDKFDSVTVGTLNSSHYQAFEYTAGIVLAAGESKRFGLPKQLLDWKGKPFVRQVTETALQAGLWPVVIVTGSHAPELESVLQDLPVKLAYNPDYSLGQSTSIRTGLKSLNPNTGSAVFLLADQPQIPAAVIRALTESHSQKLQSILAPLVLEERRANPVLFDHVTFPDLLNLTGDVGGRAIFDKYRVEYLPWHDDILLFDVDNPGDYQRLMELE
ncbi:MAG: putative selenium-dependent hydroxylase accessory protein YqeC [Chloroflexi bacterium]|nr:putative selenium-dependent hydroxylase accessory protein YqeC [Chloroflexota bacterium]